MEVSELKKYMGELAAKYDFKVRPGGWHKESNEAIVTINLQKSSYSKLFYCNINIHIQGGYGKYYSAQDKDISKKSFGLLSRCQPPEYEPIFDLGSQLEDLIRKQKLNDFFINFLVPFVEKALTRVGIIQLGEKEALFVSENTIQELERLTNMHF